MEVWTIGRCFREEVQVKGRYMTDRGGTESVMVEDCKRSLGSRI